MQDKYVGDLGDFGKYLLLSSVHSESFRLGVNWYLVGAPCSQYHYESSKNNNDGKFVGYLVNPTSKYKQKYRDINPVLFEALKTIVFSKKRSIHSIEESETLPKSVSYFSEPVSQDHRAEWFERSLKVLNNCNVLFLDPDNGLEVKSISRRNSVKYIYGKELIAIWNMGHSIIYYQHLVRNKGNIESQASYYLGVIEGLINDKQKKIMCLYYGEGSGRFYFVVIRPEHRKELENLLLRFINAYAHLFRRLF